MLLALLDAGAGRARARDAARVARGAARPRGAGAPTAAPARASAACSYDPGRERRAEQRARELLRSCVNDEEWAMYRDLGFIRVAAGAPEPDGADGRAYAYLIYPHKPIVAYVPESGRLLSEYCVEFPDLTGGDAAHAAAGLRRRARQVDGADRRRGARDPHGEHAPVGRQLDPGRVRRDLWRLAEWERRRRRPAAQPA